MHELGNSLRYPETRTDDVEDTLAGVSFPDPFRWLEESSDEVRQWQRTQAELASSYVSSWPHLARLRELISYFSSGSGIELPKHGGGRWFRVQVPHGAAQAQVVVSSEPMGPGRVLFSPAKENEVKPPFLSWIAPSPDGRTLAVGLCSDGSESNTIRLIDVETEEYLPCAPPQRLRDGWAGGVQWLPDSTGFFFFAVSGPATELAQDLYLHRRTAVPSTTLIKAPWTASTDWRMVVISRDGRHAVALERLVNPIPVAIASLGEGALQWKPFITAIGGTVAGHLIGERYIAMTDVGAPRGRLVAIPINADNPNDPATWHELRAESDAVLRTVTPVGNALYLTEFVETYARIRVSDFNGNDLGEVPLPDKGAVGEFAFPMMNLAPVSYCDKYLFTFSSLTLGWGIYSHVVGDDRIETLWEPEVSLPTAAVEDRWAVSIDGARIPYHIVRRKDFPANTPRATLIYAYGGFNAPHTPQFTGPMAAFVAAGGVYVHAHLRGGAEYGFDWWQAGRMGKKQNCYEDLFAVAEDLIASQVCTSQTLAVTGRSNGGLLAGVAATQRPDLWRAVIPRVPMLDLVGACRDPYGRMCTVMEYADIDNADEVRRLVKFSPYHLVRDGVKYPAVFIDAGDTDPRCPPWHARKFAARLQKANFGSAPVLLHVWENAGHGLATDYETALAAHTEWLAFTLSYLGHEMPFE